VAVDKYLLICGLAIASVGAFTDVRNRRIPNWLTYNGILLALAVRTALAGWPGLKNSFEGVVLGGGIFLLLFLLRGMGGGDVKLMAAVAGWAGTAQVIALLIASALAGGILALCCAVLGKRIRLTFRNMVELVRHCLTSGVRFHPILNVQESGSMRIPYGLAIALGTLFCVGNAFGWR
jgi:prepilin peptidase CpaA